MYLKGELGQNHGSTGFDALDTTDYARAIWEVDDRAREQNLIQQMNDQSMFCNSLLVQNPDFDACMSSSSSSSTKTRKTAHVQSSRKSTASSMSLSLSSSSSAPTRKTMTSKDSGYDGSGTIGCMDEMEKYGYMDLIDSDDMWDPSSLFEDVPPDSWRESEVVEGGGGGDRGGGGVGGGRRLDELGEVFMDWLKSNKESLSVEDMRKIKIKKYTVECASRRLGYSKEGKKQLVKLVLEWVQRHQLPRKNSVGEELPIAAARATIPNPSQHFQEHWPSQPPPPFNYNSWVPACEISGGGTLPPPQWMPPYPPHMAGNGMVMVAPRVQPPSTFQYMGGEYDMGLHRQLNPYANPGSGVCHVMESQSVPSWNPSQVTMTTTQYNSQFPEGGNSYAPQLMPIPSGYPAQFPYNLAVYTPGSVGKPQLNRSGSSASKEARKKRMARQRRTYFHHHNHSRQDQNNQHNHVPDSDDQYHLQPMLLDGSSSGKSHVGNWLYGPPQPPATAVPPLSLSLEAPHPPPQSTDHQGLKTEKNLKFLLQKVLKQSDVGSLGRIVVPKREAESYLPELKSRDGMTIPIEDIGTSQVWYMRYRFWPNNKSRMYLLENTGDFVKANGLQEGDFIVLYSNVKCGKYLIRGVKVRQPASAKLEGKKPVKEAIKAPVKSG